MTVRDWADLTAPEFDALDPARTVAVWPIAAIEQHGPHLPVGTDAMINEGLMRALRENLSNEGGVDALLLPLQSIGKSDEHATFKGTLHVSAETLIPYLTEIGLSIARAGVSKVLLLNSHGGNSEVLGIVGRNLRVKAGMFVVASSWSRMGVPDGLFAEDELRFGIHGGAIETSLMLHLDERVEMTRASPAPPRSREMAQGNEVLEGAGRNGFAWLAEDLHPSGVCGDPTIARREDGAALARHAVARMTTLVREIGEAAPPAGS